MSVCVIRDSRFREKAKQLNISEAALEQIVHKYLNKENGKDFPSDAYINEQYEGTHFIPSSQNYAEILSIWETNFSVPSTFNTLEEAKEYVQTLYEIFDEKAITIKPLYNGSYMVKVAKPQKAGTTVSDTYSEVPSSITLYQREVGRDAETILIEDYDEQMSVLREIKVLPQATIKVQMDLLRSKGINRYIRTIIQKYLKDNSEEYNSSNNFYDIYEKALSTVDDVIAKEYNEKFKEPLDEALEDHLRQFLSKYGVEIKEEEDLKKILGEAGILGVYDVINKIIYLSKNNRNKITFAEEFAHAFIELMGAVESTQNSAVEDYTFLAQNVVNTTIFKQVYDEYKDIYVTEYGAVDIDKIKKEAIGQALANAIVSQWDSINKSKKNSKEDKGFLAALKRFFEKILDLFRSTNNEAQYLNFESLVNQIAREIVEGDNSRLDKVDSSTWQLMEYEDTFKMQHEIDDGRAEEMLQTFTNEFDAAITGSLSYRLQTPVYRAANEPIHDIDMRIPSRQHGLVIKDVKKLSREEMLFEVRTSKFAQKLDRIYPGMILFTAYGSRGDYYITASAAYSPDDPSVARKFAQLKGSYKERMEQMTEEEKKKLYVFDFFLTDRNHEDVITDESRGINYTIWESSFEKKLEMGRDKDIFDYQRLYPFEQFRRNTLSKNLMYQRKPIVYNKEQEAAINATVEHIKAVRSGKTSQKFFTIQGKAGTGKTTIVNEILNRLGMAGSFYRPTVIMGALSHKATTVLKDKIDPRINSSFNITNKTIAGMLGMRPSSDGSFERDPKQVPAIQKASIVFIDEASMVNEEQLELIKQAIKERNIPVVFLGDVGQLPPVRSGSYYVRHKVAGDAMSPVFTDDTIPNSKLVTRVRQGESSPVLNYADEYWDFSQEQRGDYPNDLDKTSKVTDQGALIVQRSEIDLVRQLLPLFEEAKRTGNPNLVKIVPYTNNSTDSKESAVDRYNRLIRQALYPESTMESFEKGDLIIFNDTFGDQDFSVPNSTEGSIISVRPYTSALPVFEEELELEEVERVLVVINTPIGQFEVPALVPSVKNKAKHRRNLQKIAKYCKDHRREWPKFWQYKGTYAADIGYAYAIDSHKSQGSTYEVVAVDAADINSVKPTTLKTKAQSIYTALTRASNVTIVSSDTTNESTIYTDIKGINDRINAVKSGEEVTSDFVPQTEEAEFSTVTEDDLASLIEDPERKKKSKTKKKIEVDIDKNIATSEVGDYDSSKGRSWKSLFGGKSKKDDEVTQEEEEETATVTGEKERRRFSFSVKEDKVTPQEKTYNEFIARQSQVGNVVKFIEKTHTYIVNGKQADHSVTQLKDLLLGVKHDNNTFLDIASRLGSSHDAILRDFFSEEGLKDSYPNISTEQLRALKFEARKLKRKIERQLNDSNLMFITDESLLRVAGEVTYNGKTYTVAGTMDMAVIDSKGNLYIVDFKTKRANLSDELSKDKEDEYALQLSLYQSLQGGTAKDTFIAQFNTTYVDPDDYEYSFEDKQIFIEIRGKKTKIQNAGDRIYKAGELYKLFSLGADISELTVSPTIPKTQQRVQGEKVKQDTRIAPRRFTGQMVKFYGKEKRKGIRAVSTMGAILEGKRTATTRFGSDTNDRIQYWKKAKVGDIITFTDANGKEVDVRVTVPLHKLGRNTSAEEWSQKEGWSIEYFEEVIRPSILRGQAWQMEFELIKNEEDTPKTIDVSSYNKKYALLSNFGEKEFEADGKTFATVEHYYQYKKAVFVGDFALATRILKATSAKQAKLFGSHRLKMSKEQQRDWNKRRKNVMRRGMREAFEQNEDAKQLLLSTGNAMITHKMGGEEDIFAELLMEMRETFGGEGMPKTERKIREEVKEAVDEAKKTPKSPKKAEQKSSWIKRGELQLRIATSGYTKGLPQEHSDTAYIFTENAQAYVTANRQDDSWIEDGYNKGRAVKLNVSDVKGTNQAGIRTDDSGNISENAFGIIVKKYQQKEGKAKFLTQEGSFEDTEEDKALFQSLNRDMFKRLQESGLKKIMLPSKIAMGKAALPYDFAEWLQQELEERFGIISTIQENPNSEYEGYGLNIDSIQEQIVDSSLHVEKMDSRYTAEESSEVTKFNESASELRKQGWHIEFYKKKSKDGSIENEIMTISIEGNPKKGFFELVKDVEDDQFSIHFKTKSSKAGNESNFAEEALEDSDKEALFKALIYAIPEGGIVSTWGTLSKGGIAALDSLARRSSGTLEKIGERLLEDKNGTEIRVPVYKKLTEEELIQSRIASVRKAKVVSTKITSDFFGTYFGLSQTIDDSEIFTAAFTINLNEPDLDSLEQRPSILDGSKDNELNSLISSLPYSSLVSLSTDIVNFNFLYTLDTLINSKSLYAVWGTETVTIDPNSAEGAMAEEYSKKNKKFRYDKKTGELQIPKFTVGYNYNEIKERAEYNKLLNNGLLTSEELRTLSKAAIYKLSEFITMIQSYKNGYEKIFGEESKVDFTQMSRVEIINEIGLPALLTKVRDRIFDSANAPEDTSFEVIDKMDVIYDNWEAFVKLGYDTLIGTEEIAFEGKNGHSVEISDDRDSTVEETDEAIVQELLGSSIENWQVGFRQVSAFNSLSTLIKRVMGSLYQLDADGNIILDEFGLGKHLNPQEAVSKILLYTQGAQSLDDTDNNGELKKTSMLYLLQQATLTEPWLQQIIDLISDHQDEQGETVKADEQFKAQFYSNFKKYFQRYSITYQDKSGKVLIKVVNENAFKDTLLKECQAKENSFALGMFKLKTKEGKLDKVNLAKLKKAVFKLSNFVEEGSKKGDLKDLLDLNEYHQTLKEIFDLLDIATPEDESLFKLFGIKKNMKTLSTKLEYLLRNITEDTKITSNRDYAQIVELVSKEMGLDMESVTYEAGKLYYSYVLPSYLNRLVDKLKSTNMSEEEYQDFMQKEYRKYKWFDKDGKIRCRWLDRLVKSKTARENFQHITSLHYLGTEYSSKTPAEYIASMMRMYFYDNNKKWAYFRVPMMSNKPSEEYIKFERITTAYEETITRYMWDVFTQELDRIQAVRQRQSTTTAAQKIENFDKKGLEFVIADYLQKYLDGTYSNRPEYENLSTEEKEQESRFSQLLNQKLDGTLKEESSNYAELIELFNVMTKRGFNENYQLARQQWVDEGFVTLNEDGSIKKVFGDMKLSESDLKEFFWNDAFAATQILELTITDPAFLKDAEDLQKRLAQLHAPGMQAYIQAKDKEGNLYTVDGIERTLYIKDDKVKSSAIKNLEKAIEQIIERTPDSRKDAVRAQLSDILKAFKKINFADAQGYSCPSSYRKKMGIFGNWTDAMEVAYQRLLHPEQYKDVDLKDILNVLWQPLKPFVYTQITKPGYNDLLPEIKMGVQNKNSEYVLIIADALMRNAGVDNKLSAIFEFMENSQHNEDGTLNGKGIDTVQFESAVKVGKTGVIDLNDERDKDGNIVHHKTREEIMEALMQAYTFDNQGDLVYNQDYVHEIPFEDYIIQQNVPAHFREHTQAHGSQDRILTFADMLDVDPKTGEINYLYIDGEKISVKDAKEQYFAAVAKNIEESKQELLRRFKLDSSDERETNIAISRILKEAILKDARFGSDLLWACDTNEFGEFNIPLSDPTQSNRIQQLLNSVIKNTINKQEIAGGPIVQVSSWGTSEELNIRYKTKRDAKGNYKILLTESEFNSKTYPRSKGNWKSIEGYSTYEEYIEDQDGVAYFEAYAPIQDPSIVEDFLKKDADGNEYIDVEAMEEANPDLLNMIGYRIPTESKYSMAPIKVIGFLSPTAGEGIMLPADITTLSGSDFDIDKMYIMRYTFNRIDDGKYIKPKTGKGFRDNLIVSTQLAVLQSTQVQQQLFTPGNFDEPKKYGYLISYVQNEATRTGRDPEEIYEEAKNWDNDTLKAKNKTSKNLIFNNVQVQFHKQNMAAGKLIGIFAQANVSHAFISLVEGTTLDIPMENTFTLNGKYVGGDYLIDNILTNSGSINISNNLAALLAASVDAVKDPILNLININTDTANFVVSLLRMGFDLETVALLCSQPVLKDLIRDYRIRKSSGNYVDLNAIIDEYIDNMSDDVTLIDDIVVDNNALIANLSGNSEVTNYMVLQIFDRMMDISEAFMDITHMTRYNSITAAVGPFASDTMLLRIKDNAFYSNPMISSSIKEACDNPILTAFRKSADEVERKLLGQHLIQAGSKFDKALKALSKKLGFSRGVPNKIANAFSDFYMSYYINANSDGSVFDLSYEHRKEVLTQFPKDFLNIKSHISDNILINSIQYVESDREEFPFLELKTRGMSSTTLEDLKQAWISLYENDSTRDLAIKLVEYNYFRGSFGFSPKTFTNLTPNVVKTGLNNYISTLNNRDSLVESTDKEERIINQFILHNPELIIDYYFNLDSYSPTDVENDTYGECILLNKKSDDKKTKEISARRPFIKIDKKVYFVVEGTIDTIILKQVDLLGGDGQGFEISITEDFPKSIYSSTKSSKKSSKDDYKADYSKGQIDRRALGVLMDQLFQDDEELENIVSTKTSKVIDRINKDLSDLDIDYQIEQSRRNEITVFKFLRKLKTVSNVRDLLNKSKETIDDLNLCS